VKEAGLGSVPRGVARSACGVQEQLAAICAGMETSVGAS
jgi:hypothetical protein